jgi:hypothetical protein
MAGLEVEITETDCRIEVMMLLKGLPPAELDRSGIVNDEDAEGDAVTVTTAWLVDCADAVIVTVDCPNDDTESAEPVDED